ncbi:hypothetical protein KM043_001837 [Ampulex compressa]|nr:hypothetical protein KM043_001837 [Ampulex compressa]
MRKVDLDRGAGYPLGERFVEPRTSEGYEFFKRLNTVHGGHRRLHAGERLPERKKLSYRVRPVPLPYGYATLCQPRTFRHRRPAARTGGFVAAARPTVPFNMPDLKKPPVVHSQFQETRLELTPSSSWSIGRPVLGIKGPLENTGAPGFVASRYQTLAEITRKYGLLVYTTTSLCSRELYGRRHRRRK